MAIPPPPLRRRRRWPRRLIWSLLGVLVVLGTVYALRGPLLSRPLAALVAKEASQALGGRCTVAGVRGDLLRHIDIQGFALVEPPRLGALRALSASHISLTFSLGRLLRGEVVSAFSQVELDDLVLDCDFTRPDAPPRAQAASPGPSLASLLTLPLPRVQANGELRLAFPLGGTRVGHLHLGSFRIVGDGGSASLDLADLSLPEIGIHQDRWSCRGEMAGGEGVQVQSFGPLAGIMLRSASVVPDGDAQRIAAELGIGRSRIELSLAHDHLGVRLAAFDCATLPAWLRRLSPAQLPVSGVINGLVSLPVAHGALALSVDAQAQALVYRNLQPCEVLVQGDLNATTLQLRALAFDNPTAHLAASDLSVELVHGMLLHAPTHLECSISDAAALVTQLQLPLPTGICAAVPLSLQLVLTGHAQAIDAGHLHLQAGASHLTLDAAVLLPASGGWRDLVATHAAWSWHLVVQDFPCLGPAWRGSCDGVGNASGPLATLHAQGTIGSQQLRLAGHDLGAVQGAYRLDLPR